MNTKYIYLETDFHSNNKWGLLQPGTLIEQVQPDGQYYLEEPQQNPEQKLLYEIRTEALRLTKNIVGKKKIDYVFLGDAHQGTKHPTGYVSNLDHAAKTIMIENFRPVFKQLNIRNAEICFGTEAHDGMGHRHTHDLVGALRSEFQRSDIRMTWQTDIDVDGYVINVAHHGPGTGTRAHTLGNPMRAYLRSLIQSCHEYGRTPPDLVARAHVHRYHWETIRNFTPEGMKLHDIIIVPPLCGMGAFAQQVTKSEPTITNGSLLLEIRDGELLKVHEFVLMRDLVRKEYW